MLTDVKKEVSRMRNQLEEIFYFVSIAGIIFDIILKII